MKKDCSKMMKKGGAQKMAMGGAGKARMEEPMKKDKKGAKGK